MKNKYVRYIKDVGYDLELTINNVYKVKSDHEDDYYIVKGDNSEEVICKKEYFEDVYSSDLSATLKIKVSAGFEDEESIDLQKCA